MKKSKKQSNVIVNNELDYTFTEINSDDKRVYKLKRSQNQSWINKGEKVIKMVDDGNGITIGNKHFEYHEVNELFIALKALRKFQKEHWPKVKIVK